MATKKVTTKTTKRTTAAKPRTRSRQEDRLIREYLKLPPHLRRVMDAVVAMIVHKVPVEQVKAVADELARMWEPADERDEQDKADEADDDEKAVQS